MEATTVKSSPRYFSMVFALAGDSTITRFFAVLAERFVALVSAAVIIPPKNFMIGFFNKSVYAITNLLPETGEISPAISSSVSPTETIGEESSVSSEISSALFGVLSRTP